MQRNEARPKERPLRRLKGDDAKVLKQRFHADEDEHRACLLYTSMSRTPNGRQEQRADVPTGNIFKELLFASDLLFG